MKTPDQLEHESAMLVQEYISLQVINNVIDPQDWDAAAVGILHKTIELITKKEIEICFKKNSSTSIN
jgi:hypothetical protein